MPDTKETRELLSWALDTLLEGKDVWANKKFDLGDIDNLFRVMRGAPAAFKGAGEIVVEFWDMSDAEREELAVGVVAPKLAAFGIDQSQAAEATDLILDALQANARVIRFFVMANAKPEDTTKG